MSTSNQKFQFIPFIICLIIPLSIGALGGFFTMEAVKTWYTTLNKPSFNPPNYLFGPVWSTLYAIMGIASYLVWKRRKTAKNYTLAASIYFIQLVLNLMWSFIFFYQQQIGLALIEIIFLLVAIIANSILFYKINKVAGLLYIPYIMWVSFATVLTYSIYMLN
ncbi:MAG: tryptophan-rich sensory protein [Pedobacter sp.]|nr:MAG: tryptophan-rich sensory protein [Pedobacter sp.]